MPLARSILTEYGLLWAVNRVTYSAKLKLLRTAPQVEALFEKKIYVKRVDGLLQPDVDSIASLLSEAPEEDRHALLYDAENALHGRIKSFSSITLDYGSPIDWQLNPMTGRRCSEKAKWFAISDFDEQQGDIKVIWEASRFTHFYLFARAYLLSGERKYYLGFSSQLSDWLDKNPYGFGANFKCGQECALRMVNALFAYAVFKKFELITIADERNVRALVERCYRKILSNFFYAHRCIKNNHTISELMGMIIGAWCCEDTRMLDRAYRLLDGVIAEQFAEDGGYCQFSFNYQRLALQVLSHILGFSARTDRGLSVESVVRVQRSALMMAQCMSVDGQMPNYGSNDGALILPAALSGYRDFRPAVNAAYALASGKRLWADQAASEQLLCHGLQPLPAVSAAAQSSVAFADAGLFALRNDRLFVMAVLNHYRSRPAHMDQLHIDVWVDGYNVLSDSGTYSYATAMGRTLAATNAHNVVKVDGVEQMSRRGAFLVCDWTKRLRYACAQDTFLGEMRSRNGYVHKRQLTLTTDALFVQDTVDSGRKGWKVVLHTPLEVQCTDTGAILKWHGHAVATLECDGLMEMEISPCLQSLYYLRAEPATQIALVCPDNSDNIHWNIRFTEE